MPFGQTTFRPAVILGQHALLKATTEASLLTDAFQLFGVQLNFAPNKTAALIAPKGPGARKSKASLFLKATLPLLRKHSAPAQLLLASHY